MNDLSTDSPPSQGSVNTSEFTRSISPSSQEPDLSVRSSWQPEPEVFIQQESSSLESVDVVTGPLPVETVNEVTTDNTTNSNSTINLNTDNDAPASAVVPSSANADESNLGQAVGNSTIELNNDNLADSDGAIVVVYEYSDAEDKDNVDHDEGPPAKVRRISSPKSDELDAETCPICLESWGNSGSHRLVSLRCGHLFGALCVEKWLRAQKSKERTCPTCKSKANIKDLRCIYARKLVAADTTQITALQKQVENLEAEKCKIERELEHTKTIHRTCDIQLDILKRSLLKNQALRQQTLRRTWRFALEKNLEICKDGGCRVMTYNCRTYELYVSQKGCNYLFPGYGIRRVSCVDYKLGSFLHLHKKPIRDISYSPQRDLLLSVGLDGTARVVERGIPNVLVNAEMPLWSCSWDYLRNNEFYVGGVGGIVHQYDLRNPSTYIKILHSPGDMSPVVSLRSTEFGLLSCQLNTSHLWVANARQWTPKTLSVTGSLMSLCYDDDSHRVCVVSRPTVGSTERSKLTLFKLKDNITNTDVSCDLEESFNGSTKSSVMSRSTWVRAADSIWVAAHSESEAALQLHGVESSKFVSLPASEPALDVAAVNLYGNTVLAALSASRLRIYKAVLSSC